MNSTYFCCDELRRIAVRESPLNAIDYLEVLDHDAGSEQDRQRFLMVHFLKDLGPVAVEPHNVRIDGGERERNIEVLTATPGTGESANILTVEVDRPGDFSTYTLRLIAGSSSDDPPEWVDPRLAAIDFSFKVECPTPFDCRPVRVCPPQRSTAPLIDYLAKDYASFRRLMLDRMAALVPNWKERNPADLGVALVEALAYTADQLSYEQDAIATEAYLGTCRSRISARRHARLVDYYISDGCNARTWVHLEVKNDVEPDPNNPDVPVIPAGTKLFTAIPGQPAVITDDPGIYQRAEAAFETMEGIRALYRDHSELHFYTWSDRRCCLPRGATRATFEKHLPNLALGSILIFEEVLGPETGNAADADPARRHAVQLEEVVAVAFDGTPLKDPVTGQEITEIRWAVEDALPFALCVSAQTDAGYVPNVSVARGNIVLADHGIKVEEELGTVPEPFLLWPAPANQSQCERDAGHPVFPRFRPVLRFRPLTHSAPAYTHTLPARTAFEWKQREVRPAILLRSSLDGVTAEWYPRRDLINSDGDREDFVVEIESNGRAQIRFGDDQHGKRPEPKTRFIASYRVGNGTAGNVGAEALSHIVTPHSAIAAVRNPLPAAGGQDPEGSEDVRQRAPFAYRIQERAVTAADYSEVTERHPEVQRAAATFRWTGSWHTVFLTVDRRRGQPVTPEFEDEILAHVERFRMAGYDLEVDGPRFVPLEIEMDVCVKPDHFRSDVRRELLDELSARDLPDGRRGLFHPDNFTFGQAVYVSSIYAAAHRVQGVDSVHIRLFQRLGSTGSEALDKGRLDVGRIEIVQLDNDPNFAEHGVLTIELRGGK
jgi:hypothetical protein